MKLYAMAVYRYNSDGQLIKEDAAPPTQTGFHGSNPLKKFEENTLPKIQPSTQSQSNGFEYFKVGNEYHYVLGGMEDIRVIVSRSELDAKELYFLFLNSRSVPLKEILANPIGYIATDAFHVKKEKLQNNVDDLKNILLKAIDKELARGQRLEVLETETLKLKITAGGFHDETKKLNPCCSYI
jgi:hypothetical protein